MAWHSHHRRTASIPHGTGLGSHKATWHLTHLNIILLLLQCLQIIERFHFRAISLRSISISQQLLEFPLLIQHVVPQVLLQSRMILDIINIHSLRLCNPGCLKHCSLMLTEQNLLLLLVTRKLLWILEIIIVVLGHLSHHSCVAGSQVPLFMGQRRALILGVFRFFLFERLHY